MNFSYIAMDGKEVKRGQLKASNEREARALLTAKKWEILVLNAAKPGLLKREVSFGRASAQDLHFFIKHLNIVLKAGVPILEGMEMLQAQSKGKMKAVLSEVLEAVRQGVPLADALAKHPKDIPEVVVQLVRTGEASGTLDKSLDYLGTYLARERELKKRVKGAMTYPIIVFVAVMGLIFLMGLFVLPQILPLFSSLNVDLPWTTRMLLVIAEFFEAHGLKFVVGVLALTAFVPWFVERKFMKPLTHGLYLRLPIAGPLIVQLNLARFFRVLATVLEAGVTANKALRIASGSLKNVRYKKAIAAITSGLEQGQRMEEGMQDFPRIFPSVSVQMMRVGEKSGSLRDSVNYLAEFYDEESAEKLKNLSSLLEPFLLIFVGVIVGGVAFSIIGPIYSLSSSIR